MATSTDLAWAAGLFDGEGCVSYVPQNRGIRINFTQLDREVLDKFQKIVGLGVVAGPYAAKGRKNPLYTYRAGKHAEVVKIFELLKPYLGSIKQKQFESKLSQWNNRQLKQPKTHKQKKCSKCNNPHKAKGLCFMHYMQQWRAA